MKMKKCYYCLSENEDAAAKCSKCGGDLDIVNQIHCLAAGTTLQNRYLIGSVIGQGGFGITYSGIDNRLNIRVCIKEFFPTGIVNRIVANSNEVISITSESAKLTFSKGRERFLKEARLLAQLSDNPGIVNVSDYFEENNTAYIVMEFVEGRSLKEYLQQHGRLTVNEAIELLYPVMLSLDAVHKKGLIHRDISPDNIMLGKNYIKLIDFGAARDTISNDNHSMSIMLKRGYAPEEQYRRNKGVQGPWTDIYAFCATIYVCITGRRPEESIERLVDDELVPPSKLGVECEEEFEKILMKGLSVMQKDRYRSFTEMIDDLRRIQSIKLPETAMYMPAVSFDEEQIDGSSSAADSGTDEEMTILEDDEATFPEDEEATILDEDEATVLEEDDRTLLYDDETTVLEDDDRTLLYEDGISASETDIRANRNDLISTDPNPSDEESEAKKKNTAITICIMLGVAIVLIVVIVLIMKSIMSEKNKQVETETMMILSETTTPTTVTTDATVTETSETETTTKKKTTKKTTETTTTWQTNYTYTETYTNQTETETDQTETETEPGNIDTSEQSQVEPDTDVPVDTDEPSYTDPPADTDPVYSDPPIEPEEYE